MRIQIIAKILLVPIIIGLSWWFWDHRTEKMAVPSAEVSEGLLKATTWTLPNGAKVYWMPVSTPHMIDISVAFDAGSRHDGEKWGVASLTNRLLLEGTRSQSANEFNENISATGAQIDAFVGREMATLHLRTLSQAQNRDKAIALFTEALLAPAFRTSDFLRIQKQRLVQLTEENEQPAKMAENAFFKALFEGSSYAHSPLGTPETVSALQTPDIQYFYDHHYTSSNMTIAMVGDLTQEEANEWAKRLSEALPEAPREKFAESQPVVKPSEKAITFPSAQTHIWIGALSLPRGEPDYIPLLMGNQILAQSGMSSILFESVRNQKGLAYSVSGRLTPLFSNSVWMVTAQTRQEQAPETLKTIQQEVADFIAQGPTEEQLALARSNLKGNLPLRFTSNRAITDGLLYLGFYGLPLDYYETEVEKLVSVSKEDIQKAWKAHINPQNFAIVTVGRP